MDFRGANPQLSLFSLCVTGETKADDSSHKATAEEKQEEDDDYHRSDEQVGSESPSATLGALSLPWYVTRAHDVLSVIRSRPKNGSPLRPLLPGTLQCEGQLRAVRGTGPLPREQGAGPRAPTSCRCLPKVCLPLQTPSVFLLRGEAQLLSHSHTGQGLPGAAAQWVWRPWPCWGEKQTVGERLGPWCPSPPHMSPGVLRTDLAPG